MDEEPRPDLLPHQSIPTRFRPVHVPQSGWRRAVARVGFGFVLVCLLIVLGMEVLGVLDRT